MALIEISNLTPAGSELFADKESFLTELQTADSSQIFGGGGKCYDKKHKKCGGGSSGGSSGGGKGCGYGGASS